MARGRGASPYDWIQFNNFNFWWTEADDPSVPNGRSSGSAITASFADCGPRIRSWRASATNIRQFNHNPPLGQRYPTTFQPEALPHEERGPDGPPSRGGPGRAAPRGANYHYDNMSSWPDRLVIPPEKLRLTTAANSIQSFVFDWRSIYGNEIPVGNGRRHERSGS